MILVCICDISLAPITRQCYNLSYAHSTKNEHKYAASKVVDLGIMWQVSMYICRTIKSRPAIMREDKPAILEKRAKKSNMRLISSQEKRQGIGAIIEVNYPGKNIHQTKFPLLIIIFNIIDFFFGKLKKSIFIVSTRY